MDSIIRGANWYCEETNQRQRTEETRLPELSREMMPHSMGGGHFAFEIPAEIAALTAEMDVNGIHPDLKSRFGREPGDWTNLRYYESLLNVFPADSNGSTQTTGKPRLRGRVVFLKGLLNGYGQGGVKGVKATAVTRLRWSSIVLYHDIVDGKTVHKMDIQNNILIIDGVNYTAEHNQLIRA